MSNKKKMTIAQLAKLGIKGDVYYGDWDHPAIQETGGSRGLAWVVFVDDCRFWRLKIECHPEDWDNTNDLKEWGSDHELEVVEVERVTRVVWEAKKT